MKNIIEKFKDTQNLSAYELYQKDIDLAKTDGVKIPQLMPYFNRHSERGVLLIHGFSASPYEMSILTSLLEDSNFTVYNVRIKGHGTSIDALNKTTYIDWYNSVRNGYLALSKVCKDITVVGQSMGGLLAHLVGTYNKVDTLILLAPAYKMNNPLAPLSKYLKYFVKYLPRNLDKEEEKYYYNGFGIAGVHQLQLLEDFILSENIPLNIRTVMIISEKDFLVSKEFASDTVASFAKNNEIIILNNAEYNVNHILTKDDNMEAMKLIVDIIIGNQ